MLSRMGGTLLKPYKARRRRGVERFAVKHARMYNTRVTLKVSGLS